MVGTELARKMVREWGMSARLGPMAWGAQGHVFLGEDIMTSRDYSDETARVIDEEVERILRGQEERARRLLREHRVALDELAQSLLEHETITGAVVRQITAQGGPSDGGVSIAPPAGAAPELAPIIQRDEI